MEIEKLFGGIYKDKVCLITGHTGFKGSWLAFWLNKMGAKVVGYALEPHTSPSHFELLDPAYASVIGNINDYQALQKVFDEYQPDIVFHLAAQALVRDSYENPKETFETNVLGTINVFEAARTTSSVKAIVNITSDKCYDNKEWIWGYRENDAMGGHDPYSASKGCSELVTSSYQKSFFNKENKLLASARAGNVIGGGDWAKDRLIPDIMRATSKEEEVFIRSPFSTRPWQHVLEPLSGYLQLGWHLLEGKREFADGWNFGPSMDSNISVKEVVEEVKAHWDTIAYKINTDEANLHEANLLMLDCSKANKQLKWQAVWNKEQTFSKTIGWYKDYYTKDVVNTEANLRDFISSAIKKGINWTK
jgi:CDP-glucose 4,6-dehydratase